MIECYYDGELIHTLIVSPDHLRDLMRQPAAARLLVFVMLQRQCPELKLPDVSKFDYIIILRSPGQSDA